MTAVEVQGERILVATDRGLLDFGPITDEIVGFTPIEPALPVEHMANFGGTVFLFTSEGVVRYR